MRDCRFGKAIENMFIGRALGAGILLGDWTGNPGRGLPVECCLEIEKSSKTQFLNHVGNRRSRGLRGPRYRRNRANKTIKTLNQRPDPCRSCAVRRGAGNGLGRRSLLRSGLRREDEIFGFSHDDGRLARGPWAMPSGNRLQWTDRRFLFRKSLSASSVSLGGLIASVFSIFKAD